MYDFVCTFLSFFSISGLDFYSILTISLYAFAGPRIGE